MSGEAYDIVVIGGGVNGCGIARDAAGRGLSVLLAEKNDLASGTSSASTKLVHGGLRYLEQYEFGLVRESLREREVLLAMAPHIIRPMRFVLPYHKGLRPILMIRLGLFLYDHLGGRLRLPGSRHIDLTRDIAGPQLKDSFTRAFEYSDCWVDDSRLVVLNARDAAERGAQIRVRTKVGAMVKQDDHWRVQLHNVLNGTRETVKARVVINAAGPWVSQVNSEYAQGATMSRLRLVKGSHIVVRRLFEHDRAYVFQHSDGRIVFVIPYERDFTLIGTTDVDYSGDPAEAAISSEEIEYLCAAVSEYSKTPLTPEQVVWTYSGVRPLQDAGETSAHKATRDYFLQLDAAQGGPALLNVIGGKITTYRRLAEETMDMLGPWLPRSSTAWTRSAVLPGGDFPPERLDEITDALTRACTDLEAALAERLARAYGTLAHAVLARATSKEDLGIHFGAGLYQREVEYLVREEWAVSAEDILWRRSKLGLRMNPQQVARLDSWLDAHSSRVAASRA